MIRRTIAVVGSGFSGAVTVMRLLGTGGAGQLRVILVNRSGANARGLAYGTASKDHLLNVPAGGMSAFAERPDDFLDFCRESDANVAPGSFARRSAYGEYLERRLREALASTRARVDRITGEVVDIHEVGQGSAAELHLAGGDRVRVDRVVLALGNFAPADPQAVREAGFEQHPRYVRDPWERGRLDGLSPDGDVLLVGSGLTALDVALSVSRGMSDHRILCLSRHGIRPLPHRPTLSPATQWAIRDALMNGPATVLAYSRTMRGAALAAREHGDWRSVIASVRDATPTLWRRLPQRERARFLRHARAYWDAHRHRAAPASHQAFEALLDSHRLEVIAGRLTGVRDTGEGLEVSVRRRGRDGLDVHRVGLVLNCTGPAMDVASLREPLFAALLRRGLVVRDPLGLGIEVSPEFALLDADGRASTVLHYLGPLLRARDWEATAVPELRHAAASLALHLVADL